MTVNRAEAGIGNALGEERRMNGWCKERTSVGWT
jgi:hypothetical protein